MLGDTKDEPVFTMKNNTQKLITFINSLDNFEYLSSADGNYKHMGATVVDGILQSGLNYKTVVKPRVISVLTNYPTCTTTSSFKKTCAENGIKNIIFWKDDKKPNLITTLLAFLEAEKIETCQQFSNWLNKETNIIKLREIKGIGPKTVDYFKILVGQESIAIDVHLKHFVKMAGIELSNYDEIKNLIANAANRLKIKPSVLDHSIWNYMAEKKIK